MTGATMNRRSLLKASALAGGGLMLQLRSPGAIADPEGVEDSGTLIRSKELNAFGQNYGEPSG